MKNTNLVENFADSGIIMGRHVFYITICDFFEQFEACATEHGA